MRKMKRKLAAGDLAEPSSQKKKIKQEKNVEGKEKETEKAESMNGHKDKPKKKQKQNGEAKAQNGGIKKAKNIKKSN